MHSDQVRDVAAELEAAPDLDCVQRIVRSQARRVAHADGATFVLRDVDHCFYADEDAVSPLWKGQRFPITNCISGWAMLHAQVVVVPDITTDERIPLDAYRPTFVKSLTMIPVGGEKPVAAIGAYWARTHHATAAELEALTALADAAGRALERVGLFAAPSTPMLGDPTAGGVDPVDAAPGTLVASEDRERIARDLHDTVLQRLFAAGLTLQRLQGQVDDPAASAIDGVVDEIDESIRELRGVIYGLEYGHGQVGGLRTAVLAAAAESSRSLGLRPEVVFEGFDDGDVGDDLRRHATGALREMLSNVARHASASAVTVRCTSGPDLVIEVCDDGRGPADAPVAGNGLANLTARAEALGGTFRLGRAGSATVAVWSVPAAPGTRPRAAV